MGLSDPRGRYGIHSVSLYNRTNGSPYGTLRVVKGSSLNIEGELSELMGGASKFPWAVEDGAWKVEMSVKFSQFEDFLFEVFMGKAPTSIAAETSGNCSTLTSKYGSLVGSTGVATASVKAASKADLKFARYLVKAVSATTVDVYALSDVDFARGTDLTFQNDALKITSSPLTISTGGAVEIPGTGVELTGGAGTIGMTTGNTATFETRPVSTGVGMTVRIGAVASQTTPEFGAVILGQKRGNGEMFELDCFRCKGSGFPLSFEEKAWAEAEIKVKAFYDSTKDGVFDIRHVNPGS